MEAKLSLLFNRTKYALPLLTYIHILIRSDLTVAILQLGPLRILRPTAQLFHDQSKTDSRISWIRAHLTSHIGTARALRDHLLHLQLQPIL